MSRTLHHSRNWGKRYNTNIVGGHSCGSTPGWHIRMFMSRPKRHRNTAMLRDVLLDKLDVENAAFEVGNHKPHLYFW